MKPCFCIRWIAATVFFAAMQNPLAQAIDLKIDYSYDTNDFFGSGNPQGATGGAKARLAIESAADYFSGILNDSFAGIETPAPFMSQVFNGVVNWSWDAGFTHPGTGEFFILSDATIQPNEYLIFVGGRSLEEGTLGKGGAGDDGWDVNIQVDEFTTEEVDQLTQITNEFFGTVDNRGQGSNDFSKWGGSITFSNDANSNWNFDWRLAPNFDEDDFYSVALHELAHVLGFGTSEEWDFWISESSFLGPKSQSLFEGPVPLDTDLGHWQEDTYDVIYGTSSWQETAMDPFLFVGDYKFFTALDAAGLEDIGWDLVEPTYEASDFSLDGYVDKHDLSVWYFDYGYSTGGDADNDGDTDGADFLLWQRQFTGTPATLEALSPVPEPSTVVLLWGLMIGVVVRLRGI